MTVELLQILSLVAYVSAGVLFLISIALFFLLDVPKIYGEISGRTAKKAIEAIRQQNESNRNKMYKPSVVNEERGKLTQKITQSGRLKSQTEGLMISVGTEKFATCTLVSETNETTVLDNLTNETTVLSSDMNPIGETDALNNQIDSVEAEIEYVEFSVDVEMSFTGSSEIIE